MLEMLLAAATLAGPEEESPRRALAKLAIALGTVEAKGASDADYKPLAAGGTVEENTWVRTQPKSKAAFDFGDATELRLDEKTEVLLISTRRIELKTGQTFLRVAQGTPFDIKTQFSPIQTAGGTLTVSFVERDPADPLRKTVSKTVTSVICFEGTTTVGSKRYAQKVTGGYECDLVDSQLNTPDPHEDPALCSSWVHDIILARNPGSPELQRRFHSLLSMLSQSRSARAEAVFRALPEGSAPFLAKFLRGPSQVIDVQRRKVAAAILADTAPLRLADDFVALLQDADADVRVSAAKGLERLAGKNLGFDEAVWRGDKTAEGVKAWDAWVKKNK